MGLTVELTAPLVPCLFMGTEFFNDGAFSSTPTPVDWELVSDGASENSLLLGLTKTLIALRERYGLSAGSVEVSWSDDSLGLLSYVINTASTTLLCVINTSYVDYALCLHGSVTRSANDVTIPTPSLENRNWEPLFSSESSSYSHFFSDESEEVLGVKCINTTAADCITTSFHSASIRIFTAL